MSKNAASSLFKNTGIYLKLWINKDINLQSIINNIHESIKNQKKQSNFYKLFVLDGFELYDNNLNRNKLKKIVLPNGVLKIYSKKEIEQLLIIPQSKWHDCYNICDIEELSSWHILTVTKKEPYRGQVGLWLYNIMLSPHDWSNSDENLIDIIGPFFLCIGEDANLAEEIWVRSNVFDQVPILSHGKNYLPWDSIDDEGNNNPRRFINYVGDEGRLLCNMYDKWNEINKLDRSGFIRFTTELYFRVIINLHKLEYSLSENFISLVTLIEALLTPGSRSDLTYKTAARGAAILSSKIAERMDLFGELQEYYKIRSNIVHEGNAGKADLNDIIQSKLLSISRQIFLRYIALISLAINNKLPTLILNNSEELRSRGKRSEIISKILDGVIMGTELTNLIEKELEEWGFVLNYSNSMKFKMIY